MKKSNKGLAALLLAGSLGLAAASCSGSDAGIGTGTGSVEGGGAGGASEQQASYSRADEAGRPAPQSDAGVARLPELGLAIVKTADVEVEVAPGELQETVRRAVEVAGRFGGYAQSTRMDTQGTPTASITIRVPADRFEGALGDLEALGKARDESVAGEDVSRQLVDLEARLRNWQAQEAVLLKLFDRAESVASSIRVQSELGNVQLEIERLEGQLSFLEDQTSLATINAGFTVSGAPGTQAPADTLAGAFREALDIAENLVYVVIVSLGFAIPAAAVGLVALLGYRLARRGPAPGGVG